MKLAPLVVLVLALGVLNAYQTLDSGYFLYYNLSVGSNTSIFAGVDTSSNIKLLVIRSSDLSAWSSGQNVPSIYDSEVGSGVYQIGTAPGSYSVIFDAISNVQMSAGAVAFANGSGQIVNFNGQYSHSLNLSNYSIVNVTVLTDRDFQSYPLLLNLSSQYVNISGGGNLEFLNFTLTRGDYNLMLDSQVPTEAFVGISQVGSVINPQQGLIAPYSVGVASYGIYNSSGHLIPYQIMTNGVVGTANITSLSAYSTNTSDNISASGAGLQLNVELNTHADGQSRVLWLQNVADFNTSGKNFYLVNNVWNSTLPEANLSNSSISGMGNVTSCNVCGNQTFYAYSYPSSYFNYSLPLSLKLVILQNQTANGTLLSFGYQVLQNGGSGVEPLIFYDRVLLPGYSNSTMLVTPYYLTPDQGNLSGNYYDAELVFGGESGGAESIFTKLHALLWIYYYDKGMLVPFPSAYTFGSDTQESAGDVRVLPSAYGGIATTGNSDPSEQIVVGSGINSTINYIQNTSKYTSLPTTTVAGVLQSVPSLNNIPVLGSVSPSEVIEYLVYALVALAIIAVIRLLMRRM